MSLFHRSGDNTSDKVRFVAGARLHKMLKDDYLPGKLYYGANKNIGRMLDYKRGLNSN